MQTVNLTEILPYYKKFEYKFKKLIEIFPRNVFCTFSKIAVVIVLNQESCTLLE